jgi:hypothetical protein
MAGQTVRLMTATSITPTTLLLIEKAAMIRVPDNEHESSDRFISFMLSRNIRTEEDLIDQLLNSSEKRLARSSSARELWQQRRTPKDAPQRFARGACGNGRDYAFQSQLLRKAIQ